MDDFNKMLARSQRKWKLAELCSPVKYWVARRRADRLKTQWRVTTELPRERDRQRQLLEILQREGAKVERKRQEAAMLGMYPHLPPHLVREAMMLLKGELL